MKKLIYSTIIFSFAFLSAQKKSSNSFSIEYEFVTTLGKTFKNNAILKCNAKQSIYQLNKSQEKDQDIVDENDDTVIHKNFKSIDSYISIDLINKTLYSTGNVDEKTYKVNETFPNMNWELSEKKDDTKKINNYLCNKATLKFRGRNYIAWYTTKIPISFGPWKFTGLPGLILEIYDTTNTYKWTATKIKYPITEKIDFEIVKKQKLSEITLKEFISKLEAERKRRNDIMKKRLPKGVQIESSTSTNHSIELKYEWEKK